MPRILDGLSVRRRLGAAALTAAALTAGCALPASLPSAGPTVATMERAPEDGVPESIQLVPITGEVVAALQARRRFIGFAGMLADSLHPEQRVGNGDVLEISVWEAPPAMLFGVTNADPRLLAGTAIVTQFPPQVVDSDGTISVPFAGRIRAAGSTPREVETRIISRLKGKTNQIQVLARIAQNASSNVTVVGEVRNSLRVPLTPAGERLLDVLAAAGGVSQPVEKMTLQITRGAQVRSLPLETIVRDPRENILMNAGDVVTALFQPYAFSMLGAAGRNEEVPFEAKGITLTQALARAGGVDDERADRRGVFVFRFEDPSGLSWLTPAATTAEGRLPVVYQLDLGEPAAFFAAQRFRIENGDVLYVSNAPVAELQKFLRIVSSITAPVLTVRALTR